MGAPALPHHNRAHAPPARAYPIFILTNITGRQRIRCYPLDRTVPAQREIILRAGFVRHTVLSEAAPECAGGI